MGIERSESIGYLEFLSVVSSFNNLETRPTRSQNKRSGMRSDCELKSATNPFIIHERICEFKIQAPLHPRHLPSKSQIVAPWARR